MCVCVCECECVCVCVCVQMCVCACTCERMCVCMHIHVHACKCSSTHFKKNKNAHLSNISNMISALCFPVSALLYMNMHINEVLSSFLSLSCSISRVSDQNGISLQ